MTIMHVFLMCVVAVAAGLGSPRVVVAARLPAPADGAATALDASSTRVPLFPPWQVRLLHGRDDDLVPFRWAQSTVGFLQRSGLPSARLTTYTGGIQHVESLSFEALQRKASQLLADVLRARHATPAGAR